MSEVILRNGNKGNIFSHDKKTALYLFFAIFSSILITSLPLITTSFIGYEISFSIMVGTEFFLALLFYVYFLRHLPECRYKLHADIRAFKYSIALFLAILIIQAFSYFSRGNVYYNTQANLSIVEILTLVFVIPFYEEIFYRGCLFGFLCSVYKKGLILPSVITSLFFSLMHTQHYDIASQCVLFSISLIFIHVRIKTESLLHTTILHSALNAFVVILNIQSIYR